MVREQNKQLAEEIAELELEIVRTSDRLKALKKALSTKLGILCTRESELDENQATIDGFQPPEIKIEQVELDPEGDYNCEYCAKKLETAAFVVQDEPGEDQEGPPISLFYCSQDHAIIDNQPDPLDLPPYGEIIAKIQKISGPSNPHVEMALEDAGVKTIAELSHKQAYSLLAILLAEIEPMDPGEEPPMSEEEAAEIEKESLQEDEALEAEEEPSQS